MKSFLKTFFASFFALVLFFGCLLVLAILSVVGLSSLKRKPELKIERGAYVNFDMSANLTDAPAPSEGQQALGKLLGRDDTRLLSLRRALDGLAAAAKDERIAGVFLHGSFQPGNYGSGYAALKEVREALVEFKKSGKPVLAYLIAPDTRDYYLASVADDIYLHPYGALSLPGLASQPVFFANALQKYGVGVQVTRVGKYKSAVEPFLLDKMSPESREQTQKLLDDVWRQIVASIESSRKIPAADFQTLVDANPIIDPEVALQKGLVTKKAYLPDAIEELRKRTGRDEDNALTFRQVPLGAYAEQRMGGESTSAMARGAGKGLFTDSTPKIAVVYAEGEIVDGDSSNTGVVAGGRFARELRKLRQDRSVKAIVLRVNSPGGSALASEEIQRETALARDAGKPVIVSMGTVAASGGYWITTAAERVFAEPTTITGSIGVFGILPNFQKLANDYGITFDAVQTGKHADLYTVSRPKTEEEMRIIQGVVDHIYDEFLSKVAQARKLPKERVGEIAQGRVWSGQEALNLGLVDEIGGLQAALAFAKNKVGLPADARIAEYPAPKEFAEQLAELFGGEKKPLTRVFGGPGGGAFGRQLGQIEQELGGLRRLNDPTHAYARLPFDLNMD